jgi:glycosyltransferase involved in cell wall biosynthesis/GT2 family glycosyltransferase
VSVIVPTWRRAFWLERCLRAIAEQDRKPDEVIVVGRSEDISSRDVVQRVRPSLSTPLRWIEIDRGGHVAPVRRGLVEASGNVAAFLDDDAEPESGWLASLLATLALPKVACVGGRMLTAHFTGKIRPDPGQIRWYGRHIGNISEVDGAGPIDVAAVVEGNWAWRIDVLRALEFDSVLDFDDASMYGLDLCLQAKAMGYRVVYEPRARVVHHAAPRDPTLDRLDRAARTRAYSRNYTYLALKHFRGVQRTAFLVWWWLVGERGAYGALSAAADLLIQGKVVIPVVSSAYAGRRAGLREWRKKHPDRESCVTASSLLSAGGPQTTSETRVRVLIVASHPIQYLAPFFRLLAQQDGYEIVIAYCSLNGVESGFDPEFGIDVAWDRPLLEGYRWVQVGNLSPRPRLGEFFGLVNPGLWNLIRSGGFSAVLVSGYAYASFWIAMTAAKMHGVPIILGTDANSLRSRTSKTTLETRLKKTIIQRIYRGVDVVMVTSTAGRDFIQSLGVDGNRIVAATYAVDNEWFGEVAQGIDCSTVRRELGIPEEAFVVLVCSKLTAWKRPQDVLRAFARIQAHRAGRDSYLVVAGEGPLRECLEAESRSLGIGDRILFRGFVNQRSLPALYAASDVLVLPSAHEPWGLVVNEAMACGTPVVVSDRVGARVDLVSSGRTGEIYPVGDIEALAGVLQSLRTSPARVEAMGSAARARIDSWSFESCLGGYLEAFRTAGSIR